MRPGCEIDIDAFEGLLVNMRHASCFSFMTTCMALSSLLIVEPETTKEASLLGEVRVIPHGTLDVEEDALNMSFVRWGVCINGAVSLLSKHSGAEELTFVTDIPQVPLSLDETFEMTGVSRSGMMSCIGASPIRLSKSLSGLCCGISGALGVDARAGEAIIRML